jgi:hypothetical protein
MPVGIRNSNAIGGKKIIKKISKPKAKPVAKPMVKPVAKPMVKPVAKPMVKPVAKPKKGGKPDKYIEDGYTELKRLYDKIIELDKEDKINTINDFYSAQIIKSFLDDLNSLIDFCDNPKKDENFLQIWKNIENKFFYNNGKPITNEYELLTSSLKIKVYDILNYLETNYKKPKGSLCSEYKRDTGIINIKSDDIDNLKIYNWLFNKIYTNDKDRKVILNLIKEYIYIYGMSIIKERFKNRLPIEDVNRQTENENLQTEDETPQTEKETLRTENETLPIENATRRKEILTIRNNLKPFPPILRREVVSDKEPGDEQPGGAKKKKDSKVVAKRVPTPYNRFVKKHFPELKKKFPNDKAPEIMKKIAIEWKKTKK